MSDALFDRARSFFDKSKLKGAPEDPELKKFVRRLETQVKTARNDKEYNRALMQTLKVLERDLQQRRADLTDKHIAAAQKTGRKMSETELDAAVTRDIPRELRYLHASGLSLVQALNSNSKMTERELRKFNERSAKFADTVESLKVEGPKGKSYAQEKDASTGLSLTERLRQYRDGRLLDEQRHKELIDTLDENAKASREDAEKSGDLKKLGLTALLGPAAPLFQLWYDAKEDIKKLREDGKELLDKTKAKFKWETDRDTDLTKDERKKTSLFERMLKAMKDRSKGGGSKGGRRGLLGWLFGGDDDDEDDEPHRRGRGKGSRLWRKAKIAGRRGLRGLGSLGRTVGKLGGKALGAGAGLLGGAGSMLGSGLAGVGKLASRGMAWPIAAALGLVDAGTTLMGDGDARSKTAGVLGAAGGVGGAVAGAGAGAALGGTLGSAIPVIGNAVGAGVGGLVGGAAGYFVGKEGVEAATKYVWDNAGQAVDALTTAGRKIGKFFSDEGSKFASDWDYIKKQTAKKYGEMVEEGSKLWTATTTKLSGFFNDAGKATMEVYTTARARLNDSYEDAAKFLTTKINALGATFDDWTKSAKEKMENFWDEIKGGARRGAQWVGQAVATGVAKTKEVAAVAADKAVDVAKKADVATGGSVRKAVDFLRGESGGLAKGRFTEDEQASITNARAQGDKFRGGSGITDDIKTQATQIAKDAGVDPAKLLAMVQMESGGNPNAVSATGATGLLQFTGGTAQQYGVKNRFDPVQNLTAGAKLLKDNEAALKKAGIDPTLENLYLAHQQGAGGATQIINAANGKGELSEKVRANMGLNYGDKSPAEYLAENKRKIEAAQAIALNKTYDGTYAKTTDATGAPLPLQVAKAVAASPAAGAPGAPGKPGTPGASSQQVADAKSPQKGAVTQMASAQQMPGARGLQPATATRVATATPRPAGGFERVSTPSTAHMVQAPAPAPQQQMPSSATSVNKVGMKDDDFYVTDLGLIIANRGFAG